jgi:bifunctional NMN adenylyltransferase/nudix hydrolase
MGNKEQKPNVGVVVGRFQVPVLHKGHVEILDKVSEDCTKMIIVVGSSHAINTRRDPMDFKTRELMLRKYYPEATITGLRDVRDDKSWSIELDRIIYSLINPNDRVMLYGGRDSFIMHYTGKFKTTEMEPSVFYSGTKAREELWDTSIDSVEFRSGVIRAAYSRFPTTHPTVDMAVFNADQTKIILGMKFHDSEDKTLWRLPGGFVDIKDKTFLAAAKRELAEELGLIEVGDFKYVTDMNIRDWRYRDQIDIRLHTILFRATHIFGTPTPGDDLDAAKWFDFNDQLLNAELLVPGHIPLMRELLNSLEQKKDKVFISGSFKET